MKLANHHLFVTVLNSRSILFFILTIFVFVAVETAVSVQAIAPNQQPDGLQQLIAQAEETGSVRVLVQLDLPFRAEGDLESDEAAQAQQAKIDGLQGMLLEQMADTNTAVVATFEYIPYLALELDVVALETLADIPYVVAIEEDVPVPPALSSSIPVIGADDAWSAGYTGTGQTVAILDTGVDTDHDAFTTGGNRIVSEGCYSTTNAGYSSTTVCPGGVEKSTATGSGIDCTAVVGLSNSKAQSDCSHGTHVASIAAGDDGGSIVGVAPAANIIAIQIFSLFNSTHYCTGYSNCMLTYTSDQILGLERVYTLRNSYTIASVNMSIGGGQYYAACDSDSRKAAIDNLRAAGIATVIASGNDGYRDSMGAPGCISSAISVGATDDADNVASFSNIAPFIDLVAPGMSIYAAVPNGADTKHGTSMATPHVVGAWALFKQAVPGASVDEALAAFQSGAVLVDDNRSGGIETDLARINVNNAINSYVTGLSVDVVASEYYLLPNDSVEFTAQITNNTGAAASQVVLTAALPTPLSLDIGLLSGDAAVANEQITWTTGQTLNPGQSLIRTVAFDVKSSAAAGTVPFTVTTASPDMNEDRQDTAVLNINEVVGCGFSDGFESGALGSAWETAVTAEGRVQVLTALPNNGSHSVVLDDSVAGAAYSEAALILTADLTEQEEVELSFSWYDLGDEYNTSYDGVFVREQPEDVWVKVYDFSGSNHDAFQDGLLDLKAVTASNGLSLSDHFQIKFGFYDNFPFNSSTISSGDGYAFDDVVLTCMPKGLAVTRLVDNENPQPGDEVTFQITVVNNQAITATSAVVNFIMAEGIEMNGEVVLDGGTAVSDGKTNDPPLLASGLTIAPGQEIIFTVPTKIAANVSLGTVLENVIIVSSDEFGNPPPVTQSLTISSGSYELFIPLVIR
ncbi:MAG: S8 family serine peptidase [Chloroflexi bacterium]|nr:S8 family serine peptidase [Chloroflexota bacterium]